MMRESGRIVAIEDDALWVETIQQSTCGSCSARKGCGQGLMNSQRDGRRNQVRVLLEGVPASVFSLYDQVEFSLPEHVLLKGAFVVYLVPLLGMLAGMGLLHQATGVETAAALGALLGFAGGLLVVKVHSWINRNSRELHPVVVVPASLSSAATPRVSADLPHH